MHWWAGVCRRAAYRRRSPCRCCPTIVRPVREANRVVPVDVVDRRVAVARDDGVLAAGRLVVVKADSAVEGIAAHLRVVQTQQVKAGRILGVEEGDILAVRHVVRADEIGVADRADDRVWSSAARDANSGQLAGIARIADGAPGERVGQHQGVSGQVVDAAVVGQIQAQRAVPVRPER